MIDERIEAAITPIVSVCKHDYYTGKEPEYCVYNYNCIPEVFAEGKPDIMRYLVQLHWIMPPWTKAPDKRKQICQALAEAGFTYPTVTYAGDSDTQHLVFETEGIDGEV